MQWLKCVGFTHLYILPVARYAPYTNTHPTHFTYSRTHANLVSVNCCSLVYIILGRVHILYFLFLFQVTGTTYVSSAHFKDDDYRQSFNIRRELKPNTIPSVFKWSNETNIRKPQKLCKSCSHNGRAAPKYGPPSASCGRPPILDTESDDLMECREDNDENQPQSTDDHTVAPNDPDYADEPKPLLEQLQAARLRIEEQQQKLNQIGLEKFGHERFSIDPKKINSIPVFHHTIF